MTLEISVCHFQMKMFVNPFAITLEFRFSEYFISAEGRISRVTLQLRKL